MDFKPWVELLKEYHESKEYADEVDTDILLSDENMVHIHWISRKLMEARAELANLKAVKKEELPSVCGGCGGHLDEDNYVHLCSQCFETVAI